MHINFEIASVPQFHLIPLQPKLPKQMKKVLQIANIFAFIGVVVINYLSNTRIINNTTIGEVSDGLKTLFTPAGYAFAIWGLIYLLLTGFIIYQSRSLFVKVRDDSFVEKIGIWFIVSCIANVAWIYSWLYSEIGWSLVCMFVILISLLVIVIKNRMELWDAPVPIIFFLWWPFVIYSGWITVASIANVSAYLVSIDWNGWGLSETSWTILLIIIAGTINLAITWNRNMREFALVGAWALAAIAVANWSANDTISFVAVAVALSLFFSSSAHAYRNRKTNPITKLLQSKKNQ